MIARVSASLVFFYIAYIAWSYLTLTLFALSCSYFLVNLEARFYLGSGFSSGSYGLALGIERLFILTGSMGLDGKTGFTSGSGWASIASSLIVGIHLGLSDCAF